jgi:hypothetical protein
MPAGAPPPRAGKYALQMHVLDTDVAPCTSNNDPRVELDSPDLFHVGDDRWEAWSLYLPTTNPAPACTTTNTQCPYGTWVNIQEDYGAPFGGSPEIGWFLNFNMTPFKFSMDRGADYNHDQPWLADMVTGQWIDYLVHKKFSNTNDGTGFVEAWINGNPITFSSCNCTHLVTQTMLAGQTTIQFYILQYRAVGMFPYFDTYVDEIRVGTTRDSVAIL